MVDNRLNRDRWHGMKSKMNISTSQGGCETVSAILVANRHVLLEKFRSFSDAPVYLLGVAFLLILLVAYHTYPS